MLNAHSIAAIFGIILACRRIFAAPGSAFSIALACRTHLFSVDRTLALAIHPFPVVVFGIGEVFIALLGSSTPLDEDFNEGARAVELEVIPG